MPNALAEPAERLGPADVWRFAQGLRELGCPDGEPIAVAVSGGPDSVALLLLAVAARPGLVTAATVDHRLRPEAADEARDVAALCARLGVPHETLAVTVARGRQGLQAAARAVRYMALARWCAAPWLLTAHQRDDVAEATLMRLARGAGVRGLARMSDRQRLRGRAVTLLRPLLGWSRAELLGICAAAGVQPADDPSNADPRFDRVRARALLARTPWLTADNLSRAAVNLAEADAALEHYADRAWAERLDLDATDALVIDAEGLPHDTRRRLAERALAALLGDDVPRDGLETLLHQLGRGEHATLGGAKIAPGPPWRFTLAPPRRESAAKHRSGSA